MVETSDKQRLHGRIHKFPKPCRLSTFLILLVVLQRSFIKSKESEEVGMVRVSLQSNTNEETQDLHYGNGEHWGLCPYLYLVIFEQIFYSQVKYVLRNPKR